MISNAKGRERIRFPDATSSISSDNSVFPVKAISLTLAFSWRRNHFAIWHNTTMRPYLVELECLVAGGYHNTVVSVSCAEFLRHRTSSAQRKRYSTQCSKLTIPRNGYRLLTTRPPEYSNPERVLWMRVAECRCNFVTSS